MSFTVLARRVLAAATLTLVATAAQAQWPSETIRIIVGFGAGDAIDGTARVIGDRMAEELGVPVVVVNIPGAGGARGLVEAANADADGHILVMGSTGALTARPLFSDAGYTPDSFAAITQLTEVPLGVAVAADSPYADLDALLAAAAEGGLSYATPAPGSTQHINMEAFAAAQGLTLTHVGGRGGQGAITKALSGEVDFVFVGASNYTALAQSGDLRVLAVTAAERLSYLPDAPTFAELGHDLVAAVWFGLLAPAEVPADVLATLRDTIGTIAMEPATIEQFRRFNFEPAVLDADTFQARIDDDVARHGQILTDIGLIE